MTTCAIAQPTAVIAGEISRGRTGVRTVIKVKASIKRRKVRHERDGVGRFGPYRQRPVSNALGKRIY